MKWEERWMEAEEEGEEGLVIGKLLPSCPLLVQAVVRLGGVTAHH